MRQILVHLNPAVLAARVWHCRDIIIQLTWREIEGRYKGSYLGLLWSFITPLFMLSIYTFVFGVVFKGRWHHSSGNSLFEFSLLLFAGIITFTIFSECVARAPGMIVAVPNYVKKVVFPLEILPITVLGASLFHALASFSLLIVASWISVDGAPWTVVLAPIALLPVLCMTLGVSWFLASLGVYLRDVSYAVNIGVQFLYFASPVFYPLEAVPPRLRSFMALNPLAGSIEQFRGLAILGVLPSWKEFAISGSLGLIIMLLGYAWFTVTRRGFADVI